MNYSVLTDCDTELVTNCDRFPKTPGELTIRFTEQGVAMLSGVLRSERAINMNIAIMRAFVDVRKLLKQSNINEQLLKIKERLGEHDVQLNELYDAMVNMLDEKIAQLKWKDRERIGFKIKK